MQMEARILSVALGVLRNVITRLCAQFAQMCICVAVCWKCARRSACARTAGRVCRVRGYACARRARPVVRPRTERVGMVRRVKGLSAISFKGAVFVVPRIQYISGSPASLSI